MKKPFLDSPAFQPPAPYFGLIPCALAEVSSLPLCPALLCHLSHPSFHLFWLCSGTGPLHWESHLDGHKAPHPKDQQQLPPLMPGDELFWFFIQRSPNSWGKKCGLLHTHPVSSKLNCAMHEKFFGNWEQERWLNKAVLSTAHQHTAGFSEVVSTVLVQRVEIPSCALSVKESGAVSRCYS